MTTVREYHVAFEREIRHWPHAEIAYSSSRRHQNLIIKYDGRQIERPFATSSSDYRASKNAVADMRRNLRSLEAKRLKNVNDN